LNVKNSLGPDEIHPAIVNRIADIVAGPPSELYEASLDQGKLPRDWKTAAIIAIHKVSAQSQLKIKAGEAYEYIAEVP
uniref:Reverse transcriptase domain-containing protein n=1 Tax=Echinostoma caproni TaxID=27848 RepID=A0A183BBH7_9TREM